MNPYVLIFFLHNVLATLLLGIKFRSRDDPVLKNFGVGLILNSIAFAVWSAAVFMRPANLELYITVGVLFFIASLVTFLVAGTQNIAEHDRRSLLVFGVIVAVVLFWIRTFVYPSEPGFSAEGLFFFNPHPIVQVIYIFGLAITVLPAIDALASRFRDGYAMLVHYGFIVQVMAGVILLTSTNPLVLYIDGWVIGIVYLLLWTSLLFSPKAWSGMK